MKYRPIVATRNAATTTPGDSYMAVSLALAAETAVAKPVRRRPRNSGPPWLRRWRHGEPKKVWHRNRPHQIAQTRCRPIRGSNAPTALRHRFFGLAWCRPQNLPVLSDGQNYYGVARRRRVF